MPSLLFLWRNRLVVLAGVCLCLLLWIWGLLGHINALRAAVDAKPKVESSVQVKTDTRIVQGPERVVERIIEVPGGTKTVERTIYRDRVVSTTGTESKKESTETPQGVPSLARRWVLGVSGAPGLGGDFIRRGASARVGRSFGPLDISYRFLFDGPAEARHQAEVAIRF